MIPCKWSGRFKLWGGCDLQPWAGQYWLRLSDNRHSGDRLLQSVDGAMRQTGMGSGNLSPPGRLAPAAAKDTAGGGGSLVAAGSGCGLPPGGESTGAACRHEPQPTLAAAGQARRSPRTAGTDLRLVYRWL